MYRRSNPDQLEFIDFYLPFSGRLNADNRWVQLSKIVPWELAEDIYHAGRRSDFGAPIVPARVALGALIIKERLGLTDRETVETIRENPYLQYFIGLEEFTEKRPFDPSLMVEFRKRFGVDGMQQISQAIAIASVERQDNSDDEPAASTENSDAPENDNEPPGGVPPFFVPGVMRVQVG